MTLCSPCVQTKRPGVYVQNVPRVCRHHAHMLKHMCAWCRHTQGRFECTHGGVFESTHFFFTLFFQRAATHTNTHNTHTNTHTHQTHTHTHHDHQQHHDHNDTHHTAQHTTPHGDRDRDRQRQRETERRQRKRDRERETR